MNAIISPHAKATLEEYAKIRAEVLKRFKVEETPSGFLRRLSRWWKFVRKEMKRRFPPGRSIRDEEPIQSPQPTLTIRPFRS